jgi:hypothetical protein
MEKSQHAKDVDTAWERWRVRNTLPDGSQEFSDTSPECIRFVRWEKNCINLLREGINPPSNAEREAYQKAYYARQAQIHKTDETR